MKRVIFLIGILIAIGRIFITPRLTHIPTPELSYEFFSHFFAGGCILIRLYDWRGEHGDSKFYWYFGWSLGIYELIYFLVQKHAA